MGSVKELQMIGCLGKHGPYSFFKSIKIGSRTLSLSSFFPVRIWPDSAILSIAEAQLFWSDRNESFCSLRLYFLPENTPEGRQQHHGEDEVIALQDKVIIRASDLVSWLVDDVDWDWGYMTPDSASTQAPITALCKAFISEKFRKNDKSLEFSDSVLNGVVVLNYERYIRLRTILKRLEGSPELSNWLSHPLIMALGGLNVGPKCRLLFAKEVFDYPELEDHELLCNHLAPKLKGRPKKRRRRRNNSLGSESNESETSSTGSSVSEKCKKPLNGLNSQSKLHAEMKSGLKSATCNAAGVNNNVVMGANSNGLQILKIEPSVAKGSQSVNFRTRNQMNALATKAGKKLGLNNILKMCNDAKGDGRNINAELLGPALSELAQKLEKSNALQILPIRPSVIHKQEVNLDLEGPRTKRIKTEHSGNVHDGGYSKRHSQSSSSSLMGMMGPPGKSCSKMPFMGQMRGRQPDIPPHLDAKSTGAARVNRPFNKSERGILSITPVDNDLKNHGPIHPMCMRSPSPFLSTSKIYGDPSVSKKAVCKPSLPSPVPDCGEILDFSVKKSRTGDSSRTALNVNVNVNVNLESELLDLSVKSQSHSSKHIFHNLADIPPPNAMNQLGLRLTSEVTLFPSTNAPCKPNDSFLTPAHSHNQQSATSSKSISKNPKDWRGSPSSASPYVPTSGKDSLPNAHSHHHKPQLSAMDRLPLPGHSHGTAAKPVAATNDKEKERREKNRHAEKVDQALQFPSYYPKMDQNYLALFGGPMFLPPPGLLNIPGAIEQFQMYKDLLQNGIVPQFPSWPHPTGKERGPKS